MSTNVQFSALEEIEVQFAELFDDIKQQLLALLPFAKFDHIGSTSVAGSITKGDLDIAVRVSKDYFDSALSSLDSICSRNVESHSDGQYQPFLLPGHECDVGIQLFVEDSEYESIFLTWRDKLANDAPLLKRYNALKSRYNGGDMSEYRQAKSEFIRSHLESVT